ncbi:phage tail protein [Paucilactobacillus hokkaidonensis]|nr:phage tail protein [Paucilactobacillus hokkaidonensis]
MAHVGLKMVKLALIDDNEKKLFLVQKDFQKLEF